METFIALRHPEYDHGTRNLTPDGEKHAQEMAAALAEKYRGKTVYVVTSDANRCVQMSRYVGPAMSAKIRVEPLLNIDACPILGESYRGGKYQHRGSTMLGELVPLLEKLMPQYEVLIFITHVLTTVGLIRVVHELAQKGALTNFQQKAFFAHANIYEVATGEITANWFPTQS